MANQGQCFGVSGKVKVPKTKHLKALKIDISITSLSFDTSSHRNPVNIHINLILPETTLSVIVLHLCCCFIEIFVVGSENACILKLSGTRPFGIIQGH